MYEENYRELGAAVVSQAIDDYIKAKRKHDKDTMKEVIDFFKSDRLHLFSDYNGESILQLIS